MAYIIYLIGKDTFWSLAVIIIVITGNVNRNCEYIKFSVICKNERIQKYINGRNETEDDDECPEALPPPRIGRISTTERLGELLIKSLSYDGFKSSCETTPLLSM